MRAAARPPPRVNPRLFEPADRPSMAADHHPPYVHAPVGMGPSDGVSGSHQRVNEGSYNNGDDGRYRGVPYSRPAEPQSSFNSYHPPDSFEADIQAEKMKQEAYIRAMLKQQDELIDNKYSRPALDYAQPLTQKRDSTAHLADLSYNKPQVIN
jgi:hypothetical protein